jgi:hypothetical protein
VLSQKVKRIGVRRPWLAETLLAARALIVESCYQYSLKCSFSGNDATEATATSPVLKRGDRWLPRLVLFAK